MKRRTFLKNTAFASTSLMVPRFLQQYAAAAFGQGNPGKILIVVQFSGGNDGLNTVIPYRNDLYYKNRPGIGIAERDVLKIHDQQGLHPAMNGLRELYDDGLVTLLNSVGYPNPDRSHFRSMDIWHTASDSNAYWSTGWLGRYLDSQCAGCERPHQVLEVDDSLSFALKGEERSGFAMTDPRRVKDIAGAPFLKAAAKEGPQVRTDNLDFLYKTLIDTQSSADYLFEQSRVHRSTATYPNGVFGRNLKRIAELITAKTSCRVYYVSLSGFDTHVRQNATQQRLLEQYAEGMKALVTDLKAHNLMKEVTILTFSEFGRRVAQNASGGTDHGTANNVILIGGDLPRPGFFNAPPNLSDLDEGDLKYQVDFRQIYQNVLSEVLNADAAQILGRKFDAIKVV